MKKDILKGLIHFSFCIYFITLLFLTTIYSEAVMFLIINVGIFGVLSLLGFTPDWLINKNKRLID